MTSSKDLVMQHHPQGVTGRDHTYNEIVHIYEKYSHIFIHYVCIYLLM